MKYAVYTLGCKVNQYETQAVETLLRARGLQPASPHGVPASPLRRLYGVLRSLVVPCLGR